MLFFALLKSMGYNFFPVIVKCLFGSPDPVVPTHCAAIVTIDNKRYYVDVGLGLASRVIEMAIAFAKDRHCYKVILQSGMTRMEAHQLYESKGFNGESKRAFDMRLD